jgi:hypothetical protein
MPENDLRPWIQIHIDESRKMYFRNYPQTETPTTTMKFASDRKLDTAASAAPKLCLQTLTLTHDRLPADLRHEPNHDGVLRAETQSSSTELQAAPKHYTTHMRKTQLMPGCSLEEEQPH